MSKYRRLILYQLEWFVGTVFCFFFNEYCQNEKKMYFRLKPFDGITWCETNKKILVYCFSVHRNDYYDCTPPFDLLRWWKIYMSYSVLFTNGKCSNSFLSTQTSIKHRYYNIFFSRSLSVLQTGIAFLLLSLLSSTIFFFETNSSYTKKKLYSFTWSLEWFMRCIEWQKVYPFEIEEKKKCTLFAGFALLSIISINVPVSVSVFVHSFCRWMNYVCHEHTSGGEKKHREKERKSVLPFFFLLFSGFSQYVIRW